MRTESYFVKAPDLLKASLPKPIVLTDEDLIRIVITPRRYSEIEKEVLSLYREFDIRLIPLDPLAIAQAMKCGPIPYRSFGRILYPILKEISPDAVTCWISETPFILFDDRMSPARCAFTIMHEIAHVRLGHREHSKLAEIEANFFAATALCPLSLLEKSQLRIASEVANVFGISEDCAQNRLSRLAKWQTLPMRMRNHIFDRAVLERMSFKIPIQQTLFPAGVCG